ncbi:MAG TPA: hypothetical protein VF131_22830 [Blastocatellia bacterium]|nr:hypothetical protein [Blastocatellia bacterium]
MLDELFTLFLKEKQYMHNNTPKTIRYFECSFKAFKRANITELSKESIINFVAHMRQSGLSAVIVSQKVVERKGSRSYYSGTIGQSQNTVTKLRCHGSKVSSFY